MTNEQSIKRARISDEERELAARLRDVLGSQCVTQFARTLDLNHESVRRYVRGMTSPPALFLMRVARHYPVDTNWLLTGQDAETHEFLRTVKTTDLAAELERRAAAIGRSADSLKRTDRSAGRA